MGMPSRTVIPTFHSAQTRSSVGVSVWGRVWVCPCAHMHEWQQQADKVACVSQYTIWMQGRLWLHWGRQENTEGCHKPGKNRDVPVYLCTYVHKCTRQGMSVLCPRDSRSWAGIWEASSGLEQKGPLCWLLPTQLHNAQKTCHTVHSSHRHMPDIFYLSRDILMPPFSTKHSLPAW